MVARASLVAVAVAGAIGAVVYLETRERPPAVPPTPVVFSADRPAVVTCGACHLEVYREWEASLHRAAWTNPHIQQSTNGFAKTECRPCHSPEPVLTRPLTERPLFRPDNVEDGVHCVSCHGLPDGVAAVRSVPGAPCRPARVPALADRMMCNPCHEPTHQAMEEFVTSKAHRGGKVCQDCHMPRVERSPGRFGRSHGPNGGLNIDFVRDALHWECRLDGGAVIVTLGNRTGHKFPGEIPSRSLVVRVESGGEVRRHVYRKPFKGEADWPDNRLAPDEFREVHMAVPADDVRVSILWKPYPLMADEDAWVIGEWSAP